VSEALTIRLARHEEYVEIGQLTADAYVHGGLMDDAHPYVPTLRDAHGRAAIAELWVAVLAGEVVGTVTFCPPGSPYREVGEAGQGEFRNLAVRPGRQRAGVARALIAHCFARCADHGLAELVLCVDERNLSARRLYERLGFSRRPGADWCPIPSVHLLGFGAGV
jgi:ribosomal protein S18 acetylase RimI-like enzyme